MVLHEFPEGIVTFILLDRANFDRRRAVLFAFLAAGLSTPLGALISFPSIQNISQSTLGLLLSLSAGALVYVGASHLLPSVENENRRITFISLLLGVLAAVVIVLSKQ
jgi:zinc transporter ZupT